MFKLTIRDVFWLTLLAGVLVTWWIDHAKAAEAPIPVCDLAGQGQVLVAVPLLGRVGTAAEGAALFKLQWHSALR